MNDTSQMHIFGEVLFDNFPDGSRILGGAPFNVAWHLQAFGERPRFISRVGDDAPGREIAALMAAWGMNRSSLQCDSRHPTGSVRVFFDNGEPRYDIVAGSAYDFIDAGQLGDEPTAGILYHGTLAARNPVARSALQALRARHRGKIVVDVNLRAPWWERETVLQSLNGVHWVKLNAAELQALCPGQSRLETAMLWFRNRFDLEGLVVTRGECGAVAVAGGMEFESAAPSAAVTVVDNVGAGDAFAATLLLGLSRNWPLTLTLQRAQTFASALVERRGATVADPGFYRRYREQWLDD